MTKKDKNPNISRRLAFFIPELYGGGAQRVMLNLAAGLVGKGYPVDLVVVTAAGPYLSEVPEGVRLVDLKSKGVLVSLPELINYIRREKPTVLLSSLHANIIALWAKRLAGYQLRVIVCQHDTFSITSTQRAGFKKRILTQLVKYFYPWADGIVAVSKGVADILSQVSGIPHKNIHVIHNPIITPEMQQKTIEPLAHPWFKLGQPPVLISVGSLCKRKDFSTLIQAFARVRETRLLHLIVLGEGNERPALEALVKKLNIEQDVSLPGFVLNPYSIMKHASVFALSSRAEGLPTVLVEAMYCGIPVISTDCPSGPREILADGKYGQLVPVGDVDSLTQAIIKALNGDAPYPSTESWLSYDQGIVTEQYIDFLLEGE